MSKILLTLTVLSAALGFSKPAQAAGPIKITGTVAPCFKPHHWVAYIVSAPTESFYYESPEQTLGPDGKFAFNLDAEEAVPGHYYLKFGRDRSGCGAKRFALSGPVVDLGQVGDCRD